MSTTTEPTTAVLATPALILAMSADDAGGHWVTIDGEHVFIKDGVIEKGPDSLVGKKFENGRQGRTFPKQGAPPASREERAGEKSAADKIAKEANEEVEKKQAARIGDRVTLPSYTGGPGDGKNYGHIENAEVIHVTPKFVTVRVKNSPENSPMFGTHSEVKIPSAYISDHGKIARAGSATMSRLPAPKGSFVAATDTDGLPRTIKVRLGNDEKEYPVTYLNKVIAVPGKWINPETSAVHDISAERLDVWAANFKRMTNDGIRVSVASGHGTNGFNADPEKNRGYIVRGWVGENPDAENPGPALIATHQLIGEDAVLEALRNDTSICYTPEFTGTNGTFYGDCIIQNVLTPCPVSNGLQPFTQAASRTPAAGDGNSLPADKSLLQEPVMADCTPEQMARYRKLIPGGDSLSNDNLHDRVIQHLHTMAAYDDEDAGGAGAVGTMSREDIHKKAVDTRKNLKAQYDRAAAELVTERAKVETMSRQIVKPLDADAQAAVVDNVGIKLAQAVCVGAIDPATKDLLTMALVGDVKANKVNTMALSRQANPVSDRALAVHIAEILVTNKPPVMKELSGTQTMSREVPGDKEAPEETRRKEAKKALDDSLNKANPKA